MVRGVEWVEPAGGAPRESREEDVEEQVRELRDQVRRLQEQVRALASRPTETGGRLPTHVQGLDPAMEGGVPRGHVVLLAGPTGAMKTSLALYILSKNRAGGTRGVYVTLEESRDSIQETMTRLGLGDTEDFIVDIGRLRLEHSGAEEVRDWIQVLRDYLTRRREREPFGLVVIDSIDALTAAARMDHVRENLFHFFDYLRSIGVTAFLVKDRTESGAEESHPDIDQLVDGVLELRFSGAGEGRVQLLIRCAKMRHTNHSRDYFLLGYSDKRFVAKPYAVPSRRRWGRPS